MLEYNSLRYVAFVAEAYFFHINFMDQLRQVELEGGSIGGDEGEKGKSRWMELKMR